MDRSDAKDAYVRYKDIVYRRARRLLGDQAEALDVVQESFIRFMNDSSDLEEDAWRPWLVRVCDRQCIDIIRSRQRRGRIRRAAGSDLAPSPAPQVADVLARSTLLERIALEGEDIQEILVRHYVDGQSLAEVARDTSQSPRQVQRVHRDFVDSVRAHFAPPGGDVQ